MADARSGVAGSSAGGRQRTTARHGAYPTANRPPAGADPRRNRAGVGAEAARVAVEMANLAVAIDSLGAMPDGEGDE